MIYLIVQTFILLFAAGLLGLLLGWLSLVMTSPRFVSGRSDDGLSR